MKYDYQEHLSKMNCEIVEEFDKKFRVKFSGFHFIAYKKKIREDLFTLHHNFRACEEPTEYFKIIFKSERLDFDKFDWCEFEYKGMRETCTLICKQHGKFYPTPETLLNRKSGCLQCYNETIKPTVKNKGLIKFIEESRNKFEDNFSYEKSKYINTMTKLTITCREHGDFETVPNEHLSSVYGGCNQCYSVRPNTFKMESYAEIAKQGANLYVLRMENDGESFWKIGISKNISKRIQQLNRTDYCVKEGHYYFNKDSGLIYLIEKDLHKYYEDCKYSPLSKFKGSGECFEYIDIEHIQNYVYTLFKILESNGG